MNARMFLAGTLCSILLTLVFHSRVSGDMAQKPLILSPPEIAEFRGESTIAFTWRDVPSAAKYHVVLSKDRRFRKTVYENAGIAGTSVTIDNLDYGTYFFKVSAVSGEGSDGPYSDTLTFIIAPPSLGH